jgi:hypothetical protein
LILSVDRMMSDYKVEMVNDGMNEFYVEFHGPPESMFSISKLVFVLHSLFFVNVKLNSVSQDYGGRWPLWSS